jgi:xanthine dehydrogenase accessory factor
MKAWLPILAEELRQGRAATLVHVVELDGSGPREVGAQMLVMERGIFGTVGGGELEHRAIAAARECLEAARAALLRWPLGPELGQCCGGSVALLMEPFAPADRAWVERLAAAAAGPLPVMRKVTIDARGTLARDVVGRSDGDADFALVRDSGATGFIERINRPRPELWLFGAGHVGRAVAAALAPLGFAITWIDGRAGFLPEEAPAGVRMMELAMPELAVEEAAPAAWFLAMTHSHPLDELICAAALKRGDFAYLGLIGSKTKRTLFRKRLAAEGFSARALDRLTCPIGLASVASKEPAAIAASVAADLLIRRERARTGLFQAEHHER